MTELHTLINRMADRLDRCQQLLTDDRTELDPLAAEARKALAEPEPEGPTPQPVDGEVVELATAEMVRQLRTKAATEKANRCHYSSKLLTRAAELLERLSPPQPVPGASDTRYEFSVVDGDSIEQAGGTAPTYAQALSEGRHYLAQYQQDGLHSLEIRRVEVLNPNAVPVLPEGAQVIEPTERTVLVPIAKPVPVSERLPGAELCWWYEPDEDDGYGGSWTLLRIRGGTSTHTHWLPAHALPLPGEGEA